MRKIVKEIISQTLNAIYILLITITIIEIYLLLFVLMPAPKSSVQVYKITKEDQSIISRRLFFTVDNGCILQGDYQVGDTVKIDLITCKLSK